MKSELMFFSVAAILFGLIYFVTLAVIGQPETRLMSVVVALASLIPAFVVSNLLFGDKSGVSK